MKLKLEKSHNLHLHITFFPPTKVEPSSDREFLPQSLKCSPPFPVQKKWAYLWVAHQHEAQTAQCCPTECFNFELAAN